MIICSDSSEVMLGKSTITSQSHYKTGSEASVWDHEASSYDSSRRKDPVYRSCTDLTVRQIPKGTSLCLDGGCGTGLSTAALSARCGSVIAVDYSLESLRILKSKEICNVIVVQADLTALPFRDSEFNACVCANTLQHFKAEGAQQRAVVEIERVTRHGGILSLSVHHFSRTKKKAGWIKEGKPGQPGIDYIFRFSRKDLLTLVSDSLITGVGYYELLKIPFFGGRLQNVLAILFGRIAGILGFGHMLIAVTRNHKRNVEL